MPGFWDRGRESSLDPHACVVSHLSCSWLLTLCVPRGKGRHGMSSTTSPSCWRTSKLLHGNKALLKGPGSTDCNPGRLRTSTGDLDERSEKKDSWSSLPLTPPLSKSNTKEESDIVLQWILIYGGLLFWLFFLFWDFRIYLRQTGSLGQRKENSSPLIHGNRIQTQFYHLLHHDVLSYLDSPNLRFQSAPRGKQLP